MSLRELSEIKNGYDSGEDDILNDFYIPVLREAKYYKRIAGFFSSSSLSVAARGISGLIENGGHMDLLVSPRLSKDDVEIMEKASIDPQEVISKAMLWEIHNPETLLQQRRIEALGWLIANKYLSVKVATVYDDRGKLMDFNKIEESGLFHIKVGVLEDKEGNILTFSGSVNETASAWVKNVEEFKVFKQWEEGQKGSAQIDIDKFNNYWTQQVPRVKITDLPDAVAEKLIHDAPKEFEKIENEILQEEIAQEKQRSLNFIPFSYQEEALHVWMKNRRAIFEMATGTGKTKTAQLCIAEFLKENEHAAVVFIVCPQDTLAKQWLEDIEKSGLEWENFVIADSSSKGWKQELEYKLIEISVERAGKKNILFVYSTFDTYYTEDFTAIVKKYKFDSKYFLIGDEVHGMGSSRRAFGFLDEYDCRLGLSATPERWFDEYGTKSIIDYFGTDRYCFTIREALETKNLITGQTYLTPYEYRPRFVSLETDELIQYKKLTGSIVRGMHRAKEDREMAEKLENLMFMRADIHKSARNKLVEFEKILDEIGDDISDTIVFTSPGQIDEVDRILNSRGIFAKRFTKDQGTVPLKKYGNVSERQHIIEMFANGDCKALVAIKCLDEGIDIPSAKRAIILASSSSPREYIQRIGRIIRRSPGKEKAILFDVIVEPSFEQLEGDLKIYEKKIFEKELVRISEISENASNRLDIIDEVYSKLL